MRKRQKYSVFFDGIFLADRTWDAQSSELEDHNSGSSVSPFVGAEIVRDWLYQLNIHKSMRPDGIHPGVLKKQML